MTDRLPIALVFAAILCASAASAVSQAPRPLKPAEGPRGTVQVEYRGPWFARQVQTRFRLERSGYVLIGHLGGDGRISVLYPRTPYGTGWVMGGRTVQLEGRAAMYDAVPRPFSFATANRRNFSARMDSYDGRGHGYVFMIASRNGIRYDALTDGDRFEELEIEDYELTRDPRYAIRNLADALVTGPYTLKFARGFNTTAPGGVTEFLAGWSFDGYSTFGRGPWMDPASRPRLSAAVIPVTSPQGPLTPQLQRPPRRTVEDQERTVIVGGRSAFDRRGTLAARSAFGRDRLASRPTFGGPNGPGEIERSRPSSGGDYRPQRAARPMETPRMTTPQTTTTSTGGETRAERPRPRP